MASILELWRKGQSIPRQATYLKFQEIILQYVKIPTVHFTSARMSTFIRMGRLSIIQGSWLHGVNNAQGGLIMPGIVLIGSRYNQETAPDVAIDRG